MPLLRIGSKSVDNEKQKSKTKNIKSIQCSTLGKVKRFVMHFIYIRGWRRRAKQDEQAQPRYS